MTVAVVDTNVLFATSSARDEYHERARAIVRGIDHGDLPEVVVTDYVVAETLNLVGEKITPQTATDLLDRLIEGAHFDVRHTPQSDFKTGQALFRRYPDLSFVDATIAAFLQRTEIEYLYSFDDDFDSLDDVTRLTTADDPFS